MNRTLRMLIFFTMLFLVAGTFLYLRGSHLNLLAEGTDQMVWGDHVTWEQGPGDIFLYAGGLMILWGGASGTATVKFWMGIRREMQAAYWPKNER